MCGIVYAHDRTGQDVKKAVWEQYKKQESRGKEGFGVYDGRHTFKAALEKRMKRWFKDKRNQSDMLLFHHRFPTSTINVKRAAHPFNTGEYFGKTRYVLVHNGVIRNPDELKKKHEELGIRYQSVLEDGKFNDSEALLWDFALTMEGKQDSLEAYGGIAFICIKMVNDKPEKMFFGRNLGRPLKLDRQKDRIMISSEGEGEEIEGATLFTYNYELNRLTNKYFRIPSYDPSYVLSWDSSRFNNKKQTASSHSDTSIKYIRHGRYDSYDNYDDYGIDEDGYAYYREEDYESDGDSDFVIPQVKPKSKPTHIGKILSIEPTPDMVLRCWFRLMSAQNGNFCAAYWMGQSEYYAMEEDPFNTDKDLLEMATIMEACEMIQGDPQFVDDTAVHNLWEPKEKKFMKANTQQPLIMQGA